MSKQHYRNKVISASQEELTKSQGSNDIRTLVLPSNLDAKVSATNLSEEVSGKYYKYKDVQSQVYTSGKEPEGRSKKRKVTFSDQLGQNQVKSKPSSPILTRLNRDEVNDIDDVIVQPQTKVQLPPAPSKV